MKFCKTCGAQMDDNSLFCPNCGGKAEQTAPVQNNSVIYEKESSPQPSDRQNNQQYYQNYQSEPVAQQPSQQYQAQQYQYQQPAPKKKSNAGLIIGIVAGVLVLVIVLLIVIGSVSAKKKANDIISDIEIPTFDSSQELDDYYYEDDETTTEKSSSSVLSGVDNYIGNVENSIYNNSKFNIKLKTPNNDWKIADKDEQNDFLGSQAYYDSSINKYCVKTGLYKTVYDLFMYDTVSGDNIIIMLIDSGNSKISTSQFVKEFNEELSDVYDYSWEDKGTTSICNQSVKAETLTVDDLDIVQDAYFAKKDGCFMVISITHYSDDELEQPDYLEHIQVK